MHVMEEAREFPTVLRHAKNFDQYRKEAGTHAHGTCPLPEGTPLRRQGDEDTYGKSGSRNSRGSSGKQTPPDSRVYFELLPDQKFSGGSDPEKEEGKRSL